MIMEKVHVIECCKCFVNNSELAVRKEGKRGEESSSKECDSSKASDVIGNSYSGLFLSEKV